MSDSIMRLATEIMADQLKAQSAPQAASERATSEPAGPAKVVAAVATGSVQPSRAAIRHVQDWLWLTGDRETRGLPWTDDYVRDAARMIDAYTAAPNTGGQPRPLGAVGCDALLGCPASEPPKNNSKYVSTRTKRNA